MTDPMFAFKEAQKVYRRTLEYADDAKEAMARALANIPAVEKLAIELWVEDCRRESAEEAGSEEFVRSLDDPLEVARMWISLNIEKERDRYRALAMKVFVLAEKVSERPMDTEMDLAYLIQRCEIALEDPGVPFNVEATINEAIMAVRNR